MFLETLLASKGSGPPLRVALLLDGTTLPRPEALVVESIQGCDFARLELVVLEARPKEAYDRSSFLFERYRSWDRRRFPAASALLSPLDLAPSLGSLPFLEVAPVANGKGLCFPEAVVARLRALDLDVGIRSGNGALEGPILAAFRYGIWSLGLADAERYRGGPAYFWELAERNPLSGVALHARDAEGEWVLCVGHTSTHPSFQSLCQNTVQPALLGSTFVIRKLKELHERGFASLRRSAVRTLRYRGRRERYKAPTNWEMAKFTGGVVGRHVVRWCGERMAAPRRQAWRVAIRLGGTRRIQPGAAFDTRGFRWIENPAGRFFADPFLYEVGGQVYCFLEDYSFADRKAVIACATVDAQGRLQDPRPVLDLPYHLSYPCVFEDGGRHYMVPESWAGDTVDLYRAVEFPLRWEKVRTLLPSRGLDTTVLRHGGRYWFFVTTREPRHAGYQLLLFHAETLDGELLPHPCNPISADIRNARGAGAIFRDDGRLIRPSQDSGVTYGHQFNLHHITRLTPEEYAEELLVTVPPWDGMQGVHTYNRWGNLEVVDGKMLDHA